MVIGLMTFMTLSISLLIVGIDLFLNVRGIFALILLFFFFLLLGIGVGLFAKSVAAISVYILPIMFIFGFTPMILLLRLDADNMIIKVANIFPIMQAIQIHENNTWMPLGIITIWLLGAALFMYVCFKKAMTDDNANS